MKPERRHQVLYIVYIFRHVLSLKTTAAILTMPTVETSLRRFVFSFDFKTSTAVLNGLKLVFRLPLLIYSNFLGHWPIRSTNTHNYGAKWSSTRAILMVRSSGSGWGLNPEHPVRNRNRPISDAPTNSAMSSMD